MPKLTLVCATKGRPDHLIRRVPLWCRSGVDAVIVVDASANERQAARVEAVCRDRGARYVRFPPSWRNTVAEQRNFGARLANTEWVLFQDDDDDIIVEFDHAQFDRAAEGYDYVWDGKGEILVYHRRENFLRLGGFPPDMVIGIGPSFSRLVRATGRGNLEGPLYRRVDSEPALSETAQTNIKRAASMFLYGVTYPRYLERTPPSERNHALAQSVMIFVGLWRERAYGPSAPLGLLLYAFGLAFAFPWHWIRKAFDRRFRENLRLYRERLASAADLVRPPSGSGLS